MRRPTTAQPTAWVAGLVLALSASAVAMAAPPVVFRSEVVGLENPIAVAHAGDGSHRLFIAQRNGLILVVQPGNRRGQVFIDLTDRVSCCEQENGLLGLAFHPRYGANGFFFVNYTDLAGDSVIARLRVSADPNKADLDSATEILKVAQQGPNHNSAHLAFGPDGYLYVGVGDGAGDGDLDDDAQSTSSLLGKILRVDVDGAAPYAVPPDNPFVGVAGAQPEIWALGLRNPWRFGFDRETGDLYIGDVGQNSFEEINFQPADSLGGENYGWRLKEAEACYEPPEDCDRDGLTGPIFAYPHEDDPTTCGGSVIGGLRYRGPKVPTLTGLYVFADFCSRDLWGGRRNSAGNWRFRRLLEGDVRITSFGESERGHLYAAAVGNRVYRVAGRPLFASGFEDPRLRDWSRQKGDPQTRAGGLSGTRSALRLKLDGTSRRVFVRSLEPEDEPYLRAAFDLNVNRAELGRRRLEILRLVDDRALLSLLLEQRDGRYAARLVALEDDGTRKLVGVVGIPGDATTRLEVQWMQATGEDAGDGEAVLLKNDRVQARRTDLDTDRLAVDSVLLGLPKGSGRSRSGVILLDNYTSSR